MKKQVITVKLATAVDLENVHVDRVRDVLVPSNGDGYENVRFQQNFGDYGDRFDIVGDRLETDAEARKRIDAKKAIQAKKKESKQQEIERLEKALAKLKKGK